jgi:multiple antibiotic resistance protein
MFRNPYRIGGEHVIAGHPYAEAFLLVFVGMGPLKALVAYLTETQAASPELQKKVARKMVVTAFVAGISIVLIGVAVVQILEFSIASLRIAGGIILLLLSINMVMGGGHKANVGDDPIDEAALMRTAISPLAIPLLLNPVGIVTFTVFSVQVSHVMAFGILMLMIIVVAAIDYVVLSNAHRADKVLTVERVLVVEKILGIFLAALSVQLILNGLAEAGVITLTGGS